MERVVSGLGLFAFIALAWACSEERHRVQWRLVVMALALQIAFGLLILRTAFGEVFFEWVRAGFTIINDAALEGSRFVFGTLTDVIVLDSGSVISPESIEPLLINAVVAFQVLPLVIFVSCIASLLYHVGVIQAIVRIFSWLMRRTLNTSGAETFGTAALVFFGIESMPTLKGYLLGMTRSELLTIMTAFMATVAANVMVIYAGFGAEPGHLLAASLMSAPAAILIAKLLVPETEQSETGGTMRVEIEVESHNMVDAAAKGASEGLSLALNIGALLIAFISLLYLVNLAFLSTVGVSFTEVVGWLFYPFAFLMGVPWEDVGGVSQLLGTKTVVNEFIAYTDLQAMVDAGELSPRSVMIATYALCGFANPGSLGILIACLVSLVPERRRDITGLGLKAFAGGTLAVFMTACVAGILG